jgi:hypothetical protein
MSVMKAGVRQESSQRKVSYFLQYETVLALKVSPLSIYFPNRCTDVRLLPNYECFMKYTIGGGRGIYRGKINKFSDEHTPPLA